MGGGLRVVGLSVLVALARLPSSRLSCSSRCFAFYTHTNTHTHTHTGAPSQSDVFIRNADAVGACQAHNVNKDMRSATPAVAAAAAAAFAFPQLEK